MLVCQLNVELCISQVEGIYYLCKYVSKGHNRVTEELIGSSSNQRHDEITYLQDAQGVSALEALRRLYGFDILYKTQHDAGLEGHV